MKKILVGMSGGVDSSTTAALLVERGYEVIGVTLKLTNDEEHNNSIIQDAKKVAGKLGIEHTVLDLRKDFSTNVLDYFSNTYLNGYTPNPCVMCNMKIKFGIMLEYALNIGCTHIATGHYANILYDKNLNRWMLKKVNSNKDQSYFLYGLNQNQLSHALFPLAEFEKSKVRELAEKYNLPVAQKEESQDICFVKNCSHAEFIENYTGIKSSPGNFIDSNGNKLGIHNGIINYTVGQRRGLGISLGVHMYVNSIDSKNNNIILSTRELGKCNCVIAKDCNFIPFDTLESSLKVYAKIRSRAKETPCFIRPIDNNRTEVNFEEEQYFPAPGQSIVFYDKNGYVVGGGIIKHKYSQSYR